MTSRICWYRAVSDTARILIASGAFHQDICNLLKPGSPYGISEPECKAYLLELDEMGILVRPTQDTFRLRQRRFLNAIGNTTEKIEAAIREDEREKAHA